MTLATLQRSGNIPDSNERFIIEDSNSEKISLEDFKRKVGMLFGPRLLWVSSELIKSLISFVVVGDRIKLSL